MRLLSRLGWAFLFFTLFAFALNNQQLATVRFFFGLQWQGQMVFVVLVAFGLGCSLGVLAMAPHWWRQRREVRRLAPALAQAQAPNMQAANAIGTVNAIEAVNAVNALDAANAANAASAMTAVSTGSKQPTRPSGYGVAHPPREGL